jgi:isopentenyl diphosphate isomerase/L-lactate dehydrogenase-like FMN-dependent dehydrogenase
MATNSSASVSSSRREFLKFLATSPYVAAFGGVAAFLPKVTFAQDGQAGNEPPNVITTPAGALDIFDLEAAAHRKVAPGHWAYMSSGVEDNATLLANRDGFKHIELRPRRLHDATKVDLHTDLFGTIYDSPIFMCPIGSVNSFLPEGVLAVARVCKARGTLQVLAMGTSTPVEEANKTLGRPVWQQLYPPSSWDVCEKILRRVEAAGCTVIALTVDVVTGRYMEPYLRSRPKDLTQCAACHEGEPRTPVSARRIYDGIDMKGVRTSDPATDWTFVDRIRKSWKGKFIIKGIETREDAQLCLDHGIDGIIVSNHGGRSTETGRATIEALPQVVAQVDNHIPVFVDGGFRRGTDIFKALALGAKAVGIGRPMMWGLGSFGQAGVDRVLEILEGELRLVMGGCGTRTVADITRAYVSTPDWQS